MLARLPANHRPISRTICAIAALVTVLAGCGGGGSSSASSSAAVHGHPISIFEDELHLHSDPTATLALMRRLGVTRMRVSIAWSSVAPDGAARVRPANFNGADPAAYPPTTWAIYDTIAREAARLDIGLDFTLGPSVPLWANGPGAPKNKFQSWKPSASEFGKFVHAIATRYSGHYTPAGSPSPLPRISFWSIWNEPNYGVDLSPQAIEHSRVEVSPRLYRGLVDAAWSAFTATGHGSDMILIGETAPRGITTGNHPGKFSGMVPLRFIRALYCVDESFHPLRGTAATERGCPADATGSQQFAREHPGLFDASGFADHPYPQGGNPPNFRTPDEPDYADLAAIPNLESTLDRAYQAYGVHRQIPIYSTEFGYQTNPPEKIAHTTNPRLVAFYLNWAEYITWRNPRLRSYDQYLLSDPPTANAAGGFATGLEFADGTPKAMYPAFRMPIYLPTTTASAGSPIEVWGCVRPSAYVRAAVRHPVEVQFRPDGGAAFTTVQSVSITDPHGYFDTRVAFNRSGSVRLAWRYPDGTWIYSRITAITLH